MGNRAYLGKGKAMVCVFGTMVIAMKVNGEAVCDVAKACVYMAMVEDTKECGKMISMMAKVYYGTWKDGIKEGYGICTYNDGGKYQGEWKKGVRSGHGSMVYGDGGKYEGVWENDVPHGRGMCMFVNGGMYEGEVVGRVGCEPDWEIVGMGMFTYPNGDVYEGSMEKGMKHGNGT
mgnify:CR=1 FL=1